MNKKTWAVVAIAAAGLGVYGAAEALSRSNPAAQLTELGNEMQLSAAQESQWQQIIDATAQARSHGLRHADQRLSAAISTLKTPGADLSRLAMPEPDPQMKADRERIHSMAQAFYADATPAQQAQMRSFLATRLTRMQSLLHKRAEASLGAG
ncbi:MAG: hypothetical protein JWQ90_4720 [Hydrocarboniphaga sp.]|uniref:hypothetical protein n=1 Tax=Hydrocarboniphaga sp. TaxID=2033016 RepID=UPI002631D4EB|nr:hypothetical protein [Hydrocarboniphaga sp.]MDB5972270.1 hypothetical protein [Hydrocarboniphaga sp.]